MKSKYKKGDLLRWEGALTEDFVVVLGIVNNFAGNQCYKLSYLDGGWIREPMNNIECNPTITLVARGQ